MRSEVVLALLCAVAATARAASVAKPDQPQQADPFRGGFMPDFDFGDFFKRLPPAEQEKATAPKEDVRSARVSERYHSDFAAPLASQFGGASAASQQPAEPDYDYVSQDTVVAGPEKRQLAGRPDFVQQPFRVPSEFQEPIQGQEPSSLSNAQGGFSIPSNLQDGNEPVQEPATLQNAANFQVPSGLNSASNFDRGFSDFSAPFGSNTQFVSFLQNANVGAFGDRIDAADRPVDREDYAEAAGFSESPDVAARSALPARPDFRDFSPAFRKQLEDQRLQQERQQEAREQQELEEQRQRERQEQVEEERLALEQERLRYERAQEAENVRLEEPPIFSGTFAREAPNPEETSPTFSYERLAKLGNKAPKPLGDDEFEFTGFPGFPQAARTFRDTALRESEKRKEAAYYNSVRAETDEVVSLGAVEPDFQPSAAPATLPPPPPPPAPRPTVAPSPTSAPSAPLTPTPPSLTQTLSSVASRFAPPPPPPPPAPARPQQTSSRFVPPVRQTGFKPILTEAEEYEKTKQKPTPGPVYYKPLKVQEEAFTPGPIYYKPVTVETTSTTLAPPEPDTVLPTEPATSSNQTPQIVHESDTVVHEEVSTDAGIPFQKAGPKSVKRPSLRRILSRGHKPDNKAHSRSIVKSLKQLINGRWDGLLPKTQ